MGQLLNRQTAVIHFEKANPEIGGLYSLINQQFCEHAWKEVQFINREQDLGEEGLRKAKMSYNPEHLEEKFRITHRVTARQQVKIFGKEWLVVFKLAEAFMTFPVSPPDEFICLAKFRISFILSMITCNWSLICLMSSNPRDSGSDSIIIRSTVPTITDKGWARSCNIRRIECK